MGTATTGLAVPRQAGAPWERTELTDSSRKKYALDEINDGGQDLMDGKNIRGVVVHSGS